MLMFSANKEEISAKTDELLRLTLVAELDARVYDIWLSSII